MDNSTPPMFELLDSDGDDQPNIDFSKFVLNSDPEEDDVTSQPIFLLGLDSQLPAIGTSIDKTQPPASVFNQPSQPSLPVSASQAIREGKQKKGGQKRRGRSQTAAPKKKQISFKCKVNGVDYSISKKDIDVLDFIGMNLKRIADTAREKGPFGSMRSLKLQLVQVKTVLDILKNESLEQAVPRDLWDEMLQTIVHTFHETQNIVEVCKTEVMENYEFSQSFSGNFSQSFVQSTQTEDDDSLLPPTPNVRTTRQSSRIARRPSQKRKAKPSPAEPTKVDPFAVELSGELVAKRNRLQEESTSQFVHPKPVKNTYANKKKQPVTNQANNLPEPDEKIAEVNSSPTLQSSLTPTFGTPVLEIGTQKESSPCELRESQLMLPVECSLGADALTSPSPDLLADETYRMDTQASFSTTAIPKPVASSQVPSTDGEDILAELQVADRKEQPAAVEEPNIIFETQMFEPSQSKSPQLSQPVDDISIQRNIKLGRCHFSLVPYIKQGVLKSGENNIRMHLLDEIYTGSLKENGKIESNGDVFNSIGYWVRSVLGDYVSKLTVHQRKSFRIEYEDQQLAELVFNTTLTSASQPLNIPPKSVRPAALPSTQIPSILQEKALNIQPKRSVRPITLPTAPMPIAPQNTVCAITKVLIHPPEEFYRSCRCEEEMWDKQKPLPKKLLDEVSNW